LEFTGKRICAVALGKPDERVSRVGQFDASVDETLFISELRGG
jgi:hypothetical protein